MHRAFRRQTTQPVCLLLFALAGCGGSDGGGTAPDTEDPSVTLTAPAPGAVSGDVTVTATASDNESVAGVQFELDGEALGAEDTDPPYQAVWHAGEAEAGTHTLGATARDPSGNVGGAEPVEVTVAAAPTGAVEVTATTSGEGTDPDGYTVSVDSVDRGTVEANGTLTIEGLPFGAHTVAIAGISSFCASAEDSIRQVTVSADPATASFALTCEAAPGGRIAFEAVPSNNAPHEIRTIHADGSFETTVTTGQEVEFEGGLEGEQPTWSPDGSQIALIRPGVNTATLFLVNADGSELTEVATLPALANELDWGPGGTLVFSALRPTGGGATTFDLYLIEADGSDLHPVFSSPGNRQSPAWSPDGTRLAFSAVLPDGDHSDLTLVNLDGTSVEPLTTGSRDLSAAWSPDGSTLAFRRDDFVEGTSTIWLIGADGTGARKLSDYAGPQFSPSWSPDGDWVAFTSENASGQPLLIARTDGSDVRRVPGAFRYSGQPDWGPDAP